MLRAMTPQMRRACPSAVTLAALASGFASLSFTASDNAGAATAAIVLAMILDGLDGRVARAVNGTSKFGAELDSLSDVVCFGAAPAFMLQNWPLREAGILGWIASLALICCCALRLARFNVSERPASAPAWIADWFSGIPAPAGAFVSLLPLFLGNQGIVQSSPGGVLTSIYVIGVALLMVSRVPTYGPKAPFGKLPRTARLIALGIVIIGISALSFQPWLVLSVLAVCYLLFMPFSWCQYQLKLRGTEPDLQAWPR